MQRTQLATVFYHFSFVRWLDIFMRYYGINMTLEKTSSRAEAFEHSSRFNIQAYQLLLIVIMVVRSLLTLYLTGHIAMLF